MKRNIHVYLFEESMWVIFIIASWEIWKLRNGKIFDDQKDKAPG
jgi:hypothetical protein